MRDNQIITTNTFWYKIRNLFRKCFSINNEEKNKIKIIENNDFIDNISLKKEFAISNKQKEMAEEIMNGNLKIEVLSNDEVIDMIKYFIEYNNSMNQELKRIKKSIINLKNSTNN